MSVPVLFDLRDGAVLVEYPNLSEEEANRASVLLGRLLVRAGEPGLLDAIPGARTLLVAFDPERLQRARLARAIERLSAGASSAPEPSRLLRIPVVYDGEDLPALSRLSGLPEREFARRHAAARYRVAFVGFSPGFAYLAGLPGELAAPRLASPRPRVPAGSVAIGGAWTGVYPSASPGGWRLIGRTSVRLFDPSAHPPSLLTAGDRVEFEALQEARLSAPARREGGQTAGGHAIFRVLSPGLFTSVQGAPRRGLGASGVPPGGAMDLASLAFANALAGNAPGVFALEITLAGPELEVLGDAAIAVAGAAIPVEKNGVPAPFGEAFRVAPGERLRLGRVTRGARAYLAVRGGLADPGSALEPGGRILAGEPLFLGENPPASGPPGGAPVEWREEAPLRVLLGPEAAGFAPGEVERFLAVPWRVTPESDRRGLRLSGEPLAHARDPEIPPSGTVPGSIQVPGNGLPIVLGPDGPVTGGYPRIATIVGADVARLGQLALGATVRFRAVSLAQALAARRAGSTITFP